MSQQTHKSDLSMQPKIWAIPYLSVRCSTLHIHCVGLSENKVPATSHGLSAYMYIYILVGGFTFFVFHNIWDNHSHWLSYFPRWLKPPTSIFLIKHVFVCYSGWSRMIPQFQRNPCNFWRLDVKYCNDLGERPPWRAKRTRSREGALHRRRALQRSRWRGMPLSSAPLQRFKS